MQEDLFLKEFQVEEEDIKKGLLVEEVEVSLQDLRVEREQIKASQQDLLEEEVEADSIMEDLEGEGEVFVLIQDSKHLEEEEEEDFLKEAVEAEE